MNGRSDQILHVAPHGDDAANGSAAAPLRTISAAAERALPGTVIRIHAGIYRERVDPPRGGDSAERPIVYEAAGDGPAEIRGSEVLTAWTRLRGDLWTAVVPDAFFGGFHPYRQPLRGHWFLAKDRVHHAGSVFAGDHWLLEAASFEELEAPRPGEPRWFCRHADGATTFWAEFPDRDPNDGSVEITVRPTVFYPSRAGCDHITVRGLILSRAATPWSPPTTEQIGLIGTNWSKGWVIEDNLIRHSCCTGLTLGKYHDPEDHPERDIVEGTSGEDTYHGTIRRALAHGWSLDAVGNHTVRRNTIAHCEQAGICGSFGAVRCTIEDNTIHDIHIRRQFDGFEQAGIKFHGAIDTMIARNRIFRTVRGCWLDWMSQGTRVTGNLFHDNGPGPDLFTEVNHGPFLVDHNLFLSSHALESWSEGGAYVRNLFGGRVFARHEPGRVTPYHPPHSTEVVEMKSIGFGDDRYFGNIFAHSDGLSVYTEAATHMRVEGNLYLGGARPSAHDHGCIHDDSFPVASLRVGESGGRVELVADRSWQGTTAAPSSSHELAPPRLSKARYEQADGSAVDLGTAYDGARHGPQSSGPFACSPVFPLVVWPPAMH